MRSLFRASCVVLVLISVAVAASAADLARLEWGGFTVESDSSNGYQEIKSSSSDDGYTLTMTFSALEASADGATAEAKANVSGHFEVSQPKLDSFATARINIRGHIIKSSGTVAKVVVKIGGTEKTIEWADAEVASEKYVRSLDVMLPADGRLPSPFPVSIEVQAAKKGDSGAVYVSVSELAVTAVEAPKVASN